MANRNRTIYQCEAVYAGPSPATGAHFTGINAFFGSLTGQCTGSLNFNRIQELFRVQSANYAFNIARKDINQFGELAAIDRIILEQPTVTLSVDYLLANFSNEATLGFTISSGAAVTTCISGILNKTQDERNYFIRTVSEGSDVVGYSDGAEFFGGTNAAGLVSSVIGVGNGFITSYSSTANVGDFPKASVSVEALNMQFDGASTGQRIPAVNPIDGSRVTGWFYNLPSGRQSDDSSAINTTDLSVSALRPGDITLNLGTSEAGVSFTDMKVQNYNLSFNLSRQPLQKLGSKYAFSREINFPVAATLSVTADMGDTLTGSLVDIINNNTTYNPTITINKPGTTVPMLQYQLKGAKLDNQNFTSSIGANKSVSMTFSSQLSGPSNTTVGVFMSGSN